MSQCANCRDNALYVYEISDEHHVFYCPTHLPRFLHANRDAGTLTTTSEFAAVRDAALAILKADEVAEEATEEEAPKPKATKKKAAVEEAPVEEAPAAEETPAEEAPEEEAN